jgi:hypothetical protein
MPIQNLLLQDRRFCDTDDRQVDLMKPHKISDYFDFDDFPARDLI